MLEVQILPLIVDADDPASPGSSIRCFALFAPDSDNKCQMSIFWRFHETTDRIPDDA